MSGHSKWSTIKRQKESKDQKRGKIFSKLSKAISVAAKQGVDPETNFQLRLLVEKAKQANMPKENIQRAVEKGGGGQGSDAWQEAIYEGYGPSGVAVIVETLTDNKNRTAAEIKNIFERAGGSLGAPGSVSFQFEKSGLIVVEKTKNVGEQVLILIDLGASDIEEASDGIEVYVSPERLNETRQKIEQAGFKIKEAELVMQPTSLQAITVEDKAEKVIGFLNSLENHDDVQKVYANFDIPAEFLGKE